MKIVKFTYARDNLRSVLDFLEDNKPVVIVSKNSSAVLIDYNQYLYLVDKINSQESRT